MPLFLEVGGYNNL